MIKILCVGKIKEQFFVKAIEEYKKRLSKYTKLEIIEVPDSSLQTPILNKLKDKEKLLKHIKEKDFVITMCIKAKEFTSEEFATFIEKTEMINSNIVFIIGGSDGIDNEIINRSNAQISFSKLTFPHQLFRIFLLEQIYRSYKIRNNESYHK